MSTPQEPDDAEWLRELAKGTLPSVMLISEPKVRARLKRIANRLQAKAPETDGPLSDATTSAARRTGEKK